MQYLYVDDALTLFGETVCFDSPDLFVLCIWVALQFLYIYILEKRGVGEYVCVKGLILSLVKVDTKINENGKQSNFI